MLRGQAQTQPCRSTGDNHQETRKITHKTLIINRRQVPPLQHQEDSAHLQTRTQLLALVRSPLGILARILEILKTQEQETQELHPLLGQVLAQQHKPTVDLAVQHLETRMLLQIQAHPLDLHLLLVQDLQDVSCVFL